MSTREACDYLRFTGTHGLRSLYRFVAQQAVPTVRRGRTILIRRADLDRALIGLRTRRPEARA